MKDYVRIWQVTAGKFRRPLVIPGKILHYLPPSFLEGCQFNSCKKETGSLTSMPMAVQHRQAEFMILLTLKHNKTVML